MSVSAIRMGQAIVEIGGDTKLLTTALNGAKRDLMAFGTGLKSAGMGMLMTGVAMGGALVPAIMEFGNYEQALANLRAATGLTVGAMAPVAEKIEEIAKATGESPVDVTAAFSELIKAGMSVQDVLGGLGMETIQFAKVGMMPMAQAATVMVQNMKVFGATASEVSNVISQAADASTTSIQGISDAFANVGSVAVGANQSMRDMATAAGILATRGIAGAEGGTALRTVLTRLTTGTEGAQAALESLGVSAYGMDRQVRPLMDIVDDLSRATAGMSEQEKNAKLFDIGGAYGQNALRGLMQGGRARWDEFQRSMNESLPVGQKFAIMIDTLWGHLKRVWVHVQFVAIAVGEALAPAMTTIGNVLLPVLTAIQTFISANKNLVLGYAFDAAKAIAFGAALYAIGVLVSGIGMAIGMLTTVLAALPFIVIFAGVATILYLLLELFPQVGASISTFIGEAFRAASAMASDALGAIREAMAGVVELINAGEMQAAFQVATLGMQVIWLQFKSFMLQVWDELVASMTSRWRVIGDTILQTAADAFGVSTGMSANEIAQQRELAAQRQLRLIQGLSEAESVAARVEAENAIRNQLPVGATVMQNGRIVDGTEQNQRDYDAALQDAINRRYLEQDPNARQIRVVDGRVVDGPQTVVGDGGGLGQFAPQSPEVQALNGQIATLQAQQRATREAAQERIDYEAYLDAMFGTVGSGSANRTPTPGPMPQEVTGGAFGSFSGGAFAGFGGSAIERAAQAAERTAELVEENRDFAEEMLDVLQRIADEGGGIPVT